MATLWVAKFLSLHIFGETLDDHVPWVCRKNFCSSWKVELEGLFQF